MLLSRIKNKLGFETRRANVLGATFRPLDDPLRSIENDLKAILNDVRAVALDKSSPGVKNGGSQGL